MYVKFLAIVAIIIVGSLFADSLALGHWSVIIDPTDIGQLN